MNAGGTSGSETVYFEPTDTFTIAELTVRRSVVCYIPPTTDICPCTVTSASCHLHAHALQQRAYPSPYIPPPPGCKIRKTAADFGYCRL